MRTHVLVATLLLGCGAAPSEPAATPSSDAVGASASENATGAPTPAPSPVTTSAPGTGEAPVEPDPFAGAAPVPHVRIDSDAIVITPGLTATALRSVVRRRIAELRECYESLLAQAPTATGRVELRWTVTPTGAVTDASSGASTLGSATTEACLVAAIAGATFPVPDGGAPVQIVYPFVFEVSE